MIRIPKAEIHVLTAAEGGAQSLADGLRPSINLNGDLVSATLRTLNGETHIAQGSQTLVSLTLPYGEVLGLEPFIWPGAHFELHAASARVATGVILEVDGESGFAQSTGEGLSVATFADELLRELRFHCGHEPGVPCADEESNKATALLAARVAARYLGRHLVNDRESPILPLPRLWAR